VRPPRPGLSTRERVPACLAKRLERLGCVLTELANRSPRATRVAAEGCRACLVFWSVRFSRRELLLERAFFSKFKKNRSTLFRKVFDVDKSNPEARTTQRCSRFSAVSSALHGTSALPLSTSSR
jgi:hypothetical protein